jgi:probable HAF family extracellular repeat protein
VWFAKGPPSSQPSFAPTALPTLGGNSGAYGVNDAGVIVGYNAVRGVTYPVKWTQTGGTWQVTKLQAGEGTATAVNASGSAAGSANGFAVYWPAGGGAETIGAGSARAMNDAGVVAGYRSGAPNAGAVVWTRSGGVWTEHTLPRQAGVTTGFNEVDDINDDGVVVGYAQDANAIQHAVKWVPSVTSPGEWDAAVPIDARAGATNSAALGIDGPDVVGIIWRCSPPTTCTSREGYHWSLTGSGIGSLGPADVVPQGLNAARTIVGWFAVTSAGQFAQHAFVWSPSSPMIQDLGLPKGFSQAWANDVNNPTTSRPSRLAVGQSVSQLKNTATLWTIP